MIGWSFAASFGFRSLARKIHIALLANQLTIERWVFSDSNASEHVSNNGTNRAIPQNSGIGLPRD